MDDFNKDIFRIFVKEFNRIFPYKNLFIFEMKKHDIFFVLILLALFLPVMMIPSLYQGYEQFNKEHGMIMSFLKFAILATMGEALGLRIRTGVYNQPGFGLVPRALVWGFLGLTIKMAFAIFTKGTPAFLAYLGLDWAPESIAGQLSLQKVFVAFCISSAMNLIYAPVMMTLHKMTDTHIINNHGTLSGLFKPFKGGDIISQINWRVQWDFVFCKTIPLFWIPAHTLTFLLPEQFQVLFAAILGIALGVILATASLKGKKQ